MQRHGAHDLRARGVRLFSHALLGLRLLGRFLLYLLRLPLLFHIATFFVFWWYAFGVLLLYLGDVWNEGFPRGWTAWIAVLCTAPIWAAFHLLWLLVAAGVRRRCAGRMRGSCGGTTRERDGYMMLNSRGSDDDPRPLSPTTYAARSRMAGHTTIWCVVQFAFYASILFVAFYSAKHHEHTNDIRLRPALDRALADTPRDPAGYAPQKEKIFIAAAFHENEEVIPYWTSAMRRAIIYLGTDNVFVSVVENYSSDRSPELLRDFADELDGLGVKNRILTSDLTVKKPERVEWNPRIEFLAAIRNQALEPLLEAGGYDRVLFSNDVYVEPESVLELLATADGAYDFACGLDFGHFGAYDAWVLRDRAGRLTAGIWPYFFDAASYEAMKREEPVPVATCWNGIVAFAADPLLPIPLRSNRTLSNSPLARAPPASHPWAQQVGRSPALTPPLRFRASAEGECYSSESFLLPYDFRRVMALERVYVNPLVVTAYRWKYYVWHKWVLRQRFVKWFVERVWDGAWMQYARMVVGDPKSVWVWDGIECHPWW
ncbi:cryptococcal mannosyltransferase 1-domain-containing protein [Trametes maxima]|nr:cryptococcal mannosyltransferase 1-domain-containing protein [Trametes maxima]